MEKKFQKCLVVTRHQLLQLQEQDISAICGEYNIVPEFPQNMQEQKQLIQNYDAVVGVLPINLIQQIQNLGRTFVTFTMTSLGTYKTKEEVDNILTQYGQHRVAVLAPSKPGELYRVTLYGGLKAVRVSIEETPIIEHQ